MSKASELVSRMNRLGAMPAEPLPMPPRIEPLPPARPAARQRETVRITFDLDPELHRGLRLFALDQRAAASDVVRALVGLLDEPIVRQAVLEVLHRGD